MKRYTAILEIIGLMFITLTVDGQYYEPQSSKKPSSWFFGGSFGLAAGSVTAVDLAPIVGYRLTPRLSVGGGLNYQYYKANSENYGLPTFETQMYGLNTFVSYALIQSLDDIGIMGLGGITLHAEYDGLSLERRYFDYPMFPESGRMWISNYMAGFGLRQPLGERSSLSILILWSIDPPKISPYSNPVIRVGFNF
jgi:Long-chain fatty acid transport protein